MSSATIWGDRVFNGSSFAFALALVGTLSLSSNAEANDSAEMATIKAASARFDLPSKDLPVLVRVSTSRDATIKRLQSLASRLLAKSTLSDAKFPQEPDCSSGVCLNRFGSPRIEGSGRWQDGFDAEAVIAARRQLRPGQSTKTADGVEVLESEDGTLIQRPGVFGLRILGEGDAFRWVNHLNSYAKYSQADPKLDVKSTETLGRQVISDLQLVELQKTEELVFLKARQVRFTGQVLDPGERPVAVDAYFGRLFEGVPVVSDKGSTIRIQLIANGDIYSISVDWSPLVASPDGARQKFAETDEIRERIAAKSPEGRAVPLACGYFDAGARGATPFEELELGCLVSERASGTPVRYMVSAVSDKSVSEPAPAGPGLSPQSAGSNRASPVADSGATESSSAGCSIDHTGHRPSSASWLLASGLMGGIVWRRRRSRRVGATAGAVLVLALAGSASAATYSTFMYKDYSNGWLPSFSNSQWTNYADWKDEMDDEASCTLCLQPADLASYLHGYSTTYSSDLIAVATHGTNSGWPNWDQFFGIFAGKAQNNYAYSWYMEAPAAQAGATELILLSSCAVMQPDNAKTWGGYRNMFRRGNHVATGCWGASGATTCSLTDSGANTTWNEIGDELADSSSTAWFAWTEGYSVLWDDDDIIVYGAGYIPSYDCAWIATGVGWSNRNLYSDYQWGHDAPIATSYELCGYFYTDW